VRSEGDIVEELIVDIGNTVVLAFVAATLVVEELIVDIGNTVVLAFVAATLVVWIVVIYTVDG
jgi:hypothetical protein